MIENYQTEFEELLNRTESLNESFVVSYFMGGLKEENRLTIQMLKSTILTDAIELTIIQEEKVEV